MYFCIFADHKAHSHTKSLSKVDKSGLKSLTSFFTNISKMK